MIVYSLLFYIVFMLLFQNFLGEEMLSYGVLFALSLLLGYLLNKRFVNPISMLDDYLSQNHPLIHQLVLIYFPELFLAVIAVALVFYYI